jgi:hypothetical protein
MSMGGQDAPVDNGTKMKTQMLIDALKASGLDSIANRDGTVTFQCAQPSAKKLAEYSVNYHGSEHALTEQQAKDALATIKRRRVPAFSFCSGATYAPIASGLLLLLLALLLALLLSQP